MSTEEKLEAVDQSMVLWTDGGANPNPGNIGWGVHGYLYENVTPKKGSGHPTHVPTANGYVLKADKEKNGNKEVRPISYINGYGSSLKTATNNTAEIQATANGIRKAAEFAIKELTIYTDSEYVRKGVSEWSYFWKKRNWVKIDGTPVPNADDWKLLLNELDALTARGVKFNILWVKGHQGNVGNELADQLATVGVQKSTKKIDVTEFTLKAAEGYWKSGVEKHPFISNRRMYFNSTRASVIPGEYYLGEHGTDDEMLGKKISDGALCLIQLKNPDVVVEKLRDYCVDMAEGTNSIIMARLDKLYNPTVYGQIDAHGGGALLRRNPSNMDLECLDKEPLTKELRPPRLAMRVVEAATVLKGLLDKFKEKDANIETMDLTDTLYIREVTKKKDKEVVTLKFKPEFNVGFAALPVKFKTKTEEAQLDLSMTLTLGIDLLDRNALKRLETMEPKVTLIVWKEAPEVLRYATVIESQESIGIWAGIYSNMIFIPVK